MHAIENTRTGQDLGALWREAERIGRVEVDHDFHTSEYRVRIRFDRTRSGSTVWATGISPIIEQAMGLALHEAYLLAGVKG